ncbi:hypothetical protein CRENBAI_021757, partial [Crenichthys baileyi]
EADAPAHSAATKSTSRGAWGNYAVAEKRVESFASTAIDCGWCTASEAGAMPVPAGYLSDSPAAFKSSVSLIPPPPINTKQPGVVTSLLYSGSKFRGHQKSKGNSYDVEVVLQHVTMEDSYLCGYLKIKGLTEKASVSLVQVLHASSGLQCQTSVSRGWGVLALGIVSQRASHSVICLSSQVFGAWFEADISRRGGGSGKISPSEGKSISLSPGFQE